MEICQFSKAERDFKEVLSMKPGHKGATAGVAKLDDAKKSLAMVKELFEKGDYPATRLAKDPCCAYFGWSVCFSNLNSSKHFGDIAIF